MQHTVSQLLRERGIALSAPIALKECRILRPYLLERSGIGDGTAFLFAVPYYTTECDDPARNISAYAVSRDYHRFFAALFDEILPILREHFPQNKFAGFTDHSPMAEGEAAVRAGLGFFGCNHLFLTEAYSSYVFLGEIVTDAVLNAPAGEIKVCKGCGACRAACPVDLTVAECLSALTQKKGDLNEAERQAVLAHGCAWGCDRCQEACPVTLQAKKSGTIYTTIPFFKEQAVSHLTAEALRAMSDEAFAERAYSWRGRAVILRNLELLEKGEPT
ncbi:MAG: epoxyqueuosine reductase [Clostridia bacterium]|nr:epoxyqueuosine reductase [Clostridia bacterium]